MISEYAVEPELVANLADRHNYNFFLREFGLGQGRLVSRYPKKWAKQVWEAHIEGSDLDRTRLTELMARLKERMIKRKDYLWEDSQKIWLENALLEHDRFPFRAILTRTNPEKRPDILCEDDLGASSCPAWDMPSGVRVARQAQMMADAVRPMLASCSWVKFIDPYIKSGRAGFRHSMRAFFQILAADRPVGPPATIELHTGLLKIENKKFMNFFIREYEKIIPAEWRVTLYQWESKVGGQNLYDRYILTDIGGVLFGAGLDEGLKGKKDDIIRLDLEPYRLCCGEYDLTRPAFREAAPPLELIGKR